MFKLVKIVVNGLGILLLGFMLFATAPIWTGLFYTEEEQFSEANWNESHQLKRLKMAQDIVKREVLTSKNRDEIIALLGKPDHQGHGRIGYFLSLTTVDYMMLTIKFDQSGKFAEAFIHQT